MHLYIWFFCVPMLCNIHLTRPNQIKSNHVHSSWICWVMTSSSKWQLGVIIILTITCQSNRLAQGWTASKWQTCPYIVQNMLLRTKDQEERDTKGVPSAHWRCDKLIGSKAHSIFGECDVTTAITTQRRREGLAGHNGRDFSMYQVSTFKCSCHHLTPC